jgi:hypothetical protein
MGRYAFFNTEFEYKFWFGIQSSEDILMFGGSDMSVEAGRPAHRWKQDDALKIYDELKFMISAFDFKMPEWELFEKNLNGTHKLYDELNCYVKGGVGPDTAMARFFLGCLLFHQLKYAPEGILEVKYEL